MVQKEVLAKVASEDVEVFVVWIPMFPGDDREKALGARNLVPDRRARHFWDGELKLGKRYRDVLSLSKGIEVAWDVYLVFEEDVEWKERPVSPAHWQHQLSGVDSGRRLDGGVLYSAVERLVRDSSDRSPSSNSSRPR